LRSARKKKNAKDAKNREGRKGISVKRLSEGVIACAIQVSKSLRNGFLEKVYGNALAIEMKDAGIVFQREHPISVRYRDSVVGEYVADFLIDSRLIVEIKAVHSLAKEHEWQVLNYLSATDVPVGLLLNFGSSRLQIKRLARNYAEDNPI
jgi:GxxExxY protein